LPELPLLPVSLYRDWLMYGQLPFDPLQTRADLVEEFRFLVVRVAELKGEVD
jgi:hypothetical protein